MFIETHLVTSDEHVLRSLLRLNYIAVVSLARIKDAGDDLLILRKIRGLRRRIPFTVTFIEGNNRYMLNKYITNDNIDVITILPGPEYPSRRQLSIIEDEGKYIELVALPFVRRGLIGDLSKVALDIMDYSTKAVLTIGVESINDVKNPIDLVNLMTLLTGDKGYWIKAIKDNPISLIVDSIYKSGVCI
ncbi:hypothetical protein [Caldivirga maquilingensis]|uniref:RNase P subunit p30 n=1 Tax=Caldivirga maquilingensis (strain ATCC 700844 / DSM 13496 / JCM 10307 / IC-167) TaxID=397948 RepID=A8M8S6_CALMQ|nr:hypothetical protein [Caldivirga maquilingensis]ABW02145.1 hypothetical protein Cmaq_1319 [Caldivirga maquilingensis IC-167]